MGFKQPEFNGKIISELERLHDEGTVRVIERSRSTRDADREIEVQHPSSLTKEQAIEVASVVSALVGLGIAGEEGAEQGSAVGAEAAADGVELFSDEQAWDVIDEIPNDSAAALILLEHHWAVPLCDAIAEAGGFRINDGSVSPLDLVDIGLVTAEEAEQLHAIEIAAPAQ